MRNLLLPSVLPQAPVLSLRTARARTTIAALATAIGGSNVPDGTVIRFSSTAGVLSASSVSTTGGVAHVTLTSAGIPEQAVVSANFIEGSSAASAKVSVEFTNDKAVANTNQSEQDWIRMSSADYLGYSEDSRVAEAFAKKQGVQFSFRGISIDANSMQVDLTADVVRARNASMSYNHKPVVNANSLYYEFLNHTGNAIVTDMPGEGTIETVKISGVVPVIQPLSVSEAPGGTIYQFSICPRTM